MMTMPLCLGCLLAPNDCSLCIAYLAILSPLALDRFSWDLSFSLTNLSIYGNLNSFQASPCRWLLPGELLCWGDIRRHSEKCPPAIWCDKCHEVIASFIPGLLARNSVPPSVTHSTSGLTHSECSNPGLALSSWSNRSGGSQYKPTKHSILVVCYLPLPLLLVLRRDFS